MYNSYAEATAQNEAVSQDPVYFEEIARVTMASMIVDLRNGKQRSSSTVTDKFLDRFAHGTQEKQGEEPTLEE